MSESKHTPGRLDPTWHFIPQAGRYIAAYCTGKAWQEPERFYAEANANARRMVALWNAADELGLSTEAIEGGAIQGLAKACRAVILSPCRLTREEWLPLASIVSTVGEIYTKAFGEDACRELWQPKAKAGSRK